MNATIEEPTELLTAISSDTLLDALNWRYAIKAFDPTRKVSDDDWDTLENAVILSPSSYGLQPWKLVVVTDPEIRESLLPSSWGQRQVVDASHLVVFASKTSITEADVTALIEHTAATRAMRAASLDGYKALIASSVLDPAFPVAEWAARQAYLALGNLLTSAALLGIDALPMEGFEPADYDRILGLTELGLRSAVVCTIGYRSPDDPYASLAKVRFPASERILRI